MDGTGPDRTRRRFRLRIPILATRRLTLLAVALSTISAITIMSAALAAAPGSILNAPLNDNATTVDVATADGDDDDGGASFADAFFIARRVDARGERQIEWLGSLVIWLLLLMSLVSLGLIGQMSLANHRKTILPDGATDELDVLLRDGEYRRAINVVKGNETLFSALMHTTLLQAAHGHAAMLNALVQTADELAAQRIRRIEILNVLGQVSPMIGLFGTVYGMILAFQSIVAAGGTADPVRLAGGISTALTTTFWGLVVAIPALAAYALLRARIEGLTAEAAMAGETLLARFRPAGEKGVETASASKTKKKSSGS